VGGIRIAMIAKSGTGSLTRAGNYSASPAGPTIWEARPLEQAGDPFAYEDIVVGHDNPASAHC
jgi:hypothetical protein